MRANYNLFLIFSPCVQCGHLGVHPDPEAADGLAEVPEEDV